MGLAIGDAIIWFGDFLTFVIFARAIMTWLPINRNGMIFTVLNSITEPFVGPVRKLISRSPLGGPGMMIDFSPIITLLLIRPITQFLAMMVVSIF